MARVNQLIEHQDFISYQRKIDQIEIERKFCRHGFEHGLNVARIAYAYILEQGDRELDKEVVYAAALLHDIGRWVEYQNGEDHAVVSARLARPLLEDCKFGVAEVDLITEGIREHRQHSAKALSRLGQALALADEWARDCRNCPAQKECYKFSSEMRKITY